MDSRDALFAHQHEAERVQERGTLRRVHERLAQDRLGVGVATGRAVEIGEVDRRRHERRIDRERALRAPLRRVEALLLGVQHGERQMRLRPIAVELLRGDELRGRRPSASRSAGGSDLGRHAGQRRRRLDAHRPDRIVEQRRQQRRAQLRLGVGERMHRGATHQRDLASPSASRTTVSAGGTA